MEKDLQLTDAEIGEIIEVQGREFEEKIRLAEIAQMMHRLKQEETAIINRIEKSSLEKEMLYEKLCNSRKLENKYVPDLNTGSLVENNLIQSLFSKPEKNKEDELDKKQSDIERRSGNAVNLSLDIKEE